MTPPREPIQIEATERLTDGRLVEFRVVLHPDGAPADVDPVRECDQIARELRRVAGDLLRPLDGEVLDGQPDELQAQFLDRYQVAATAVLSEHGCTVEGIEVDIDPVRDPVVDGFRRRVDELQEASGHTDAMVHTRISYRRAGRAAARMA